MRNLPLYAAMYYMYASLALLVVAADTASQDRYLDGDIDRPCSLICLNGGSCSLSTDAEVAQLGRPSQYCDCPEGYGGITCEYIAEQCGFVDTSLADAMHDEASREDAADAATASATAGASALQKRYCMHGAPCKMTVDASTNTQKHTCECNNAIEAGAYAGISCEHAATAYCR